MFSLRLELNLNYFDKFHDPNDYTLAIYIQRFKGKHEFRPQPELCSCNRVHFHRTESRCIPLSICDILKYNINVNYCKHNYGGHWPISQM